MSDQQGGAALRALPGSEPDAAAQPEPTASGISPPQRKAGSRFISDVIVELGFVPRERVEAAVEEGKKTGRPPEQLLIESGAISADQYARAVAQRFGLYHVDLLN